LCLAYQHLARRNKVGDDVEFGVVQMKRLAVDLTVHLRVGEKYLGRATLGNDIASIPDSSSSLMDCVARIIAALCLRHVF
jgi:hypothetical protein